MTHDHKSMSESGGSSNGNPTTSHTTCYTDRIHVLEELVQTLQRENDQLKQQLLILQAAVAVSDPKQQQQQSTTTLISTSSGKDPAKLTSTNSTTDIETTSTTLSCSDAGMNSSHDTTGTSTAGVLDSSSSSAMSTNTFTQQAFSNEMIERYSRQMLVIGVQGQRSIHQSKVLVIGAGGIGSTVLYYLAACGVGTIGILDHDIVDVTNLHRQIIHTTERVGMYKVLSAQQTIYNINPTITVQTVCESITTDNAIRYIEQYDLVIDATDNLLSRYIINDACVLLQKPLISGSAITTQGQITIYNNSRNNNNCCYRCMYPLQQARKNSNTDAACQTCNDAGVLGPVPGLIGILQAMEAIKFITSTFDSERQTNNTNTTTTNKSSRMENYLLMYDSMSCSFLSIKKPSKNTNCILCGTNPIIRSMDDSYINLQENLLLPQACNTSTVTIPTTKSTNPHYPYAVRDITCNDYYQTILLPQQEHILLDVRVQKQYDICSLSNSINIPLSEIISWSRSNTKVDGQNKDSSHCPNTTINRIQQLSNNYSIPIYCICRRGIASQQAVQVLHELYNNHNQNQYSHPKGTKDHLNDNNESSSKPKIFNIVGGYVAWQKTVNASFPVY